MPERALCLNMPLRLISFAEITVTGEGRLANETGSFRAVTLDGTSTVSIRGLISEASDMSKQYKVTDANIREEVEIFQNTQYLN